MPQRVLRPLDYGALFDELFDIYKRNFLLLAGIAGVLFVPMTLLLRTMLSHQYRMVIPMPTPTNPHRAPMPDFGLLLVSLAWVYGAAIVYGILDNIVVATTTQAISGVYLGSKPTILGSYKAILPKLPMFILLMISVGIMESAGFMLCCVPGIALAILFAFVPQVFIIEGRSFGDSIRRSWDLAKAEWVRVFVVGLITLLLLYTVQFAITLPAQLLMPLVVKSGSAAGWYSTLMAVLQGLGQALVMPIQVIAFVLLYYDIRVRREGFDIEMLAQSMGGAAPTPVQPEPPAFDLGKGDGSQE